MHNLARSAALALAGLQACGTHSAASVREPQAPASAPDAWRAPADAAAAYLASVPGGAAALVERVREADLTQARPPADLASPSAASTSPHASEVLELARRAQAEDAGAVAPAAVGDALQELESRCASVTAARLCLGPDVGRAQVGVILALAGRATIPLGPHTPVSWDSSRWDEEGNVLPAPPLIAYDVPVPPGFRLVPWDPAVDGTESRRFEGEWDTVMVGAVITVRTPDWLMGRSSASSESCSLLDATLGDRVAQDPVVAEMGGPECARVGQTHAAWVEDPTRPLLWTVTVLTGDQLRPARMAAEMASMEAWPLFPGVPRPEPPHNVAEANRIAFAAGERASMPTSDGWVSDRLNRRASFARTHWVTATRPDWQVSAVDHVDLRPSGAIHVFSPERADGPRTSVPRELSPEPPDPAVLEAALAEVAGSCPQLDALRDDALPDPNECRSQANGMNCEVETSGTVRRFFHGWQGNGIDGSGVATWCAVDLATCAARVVRTGADNIDPSAGYAAWASHADAPHFEDFPTWGAIAWPRSARETFPGAPVLTGRPPTYGGANACHPRIGFGTMRVSAGAWQPGRPGTIPARLVRMGGEGPVPASLGGVLRENGTRYSELNFQPEARHQALVFYSAGRHRYSGEVLAVHDESTDRHRILFDAKTSAQRGNIQIHDVSEMVVLFSVTGDPRVDFYYPPAFFLINVATSVGGSLDLYFARPGAAADDPYSAGDDFLEEAGYYDASFIGETFLSTESETPTVFAIEAAGSNEAPCERQASLAELVRRMSGRNPRR